MLCLALRSDPRLVYERALRKFSVQEISEGFAAARGLALPSQLRRMLREQGRDLHTEFLQLLPERPHPIRIQRWSARRVGLLLLMVPLAALLIPAARMVVESNDQTTTLLNLTSLDCAADLEPLWLMAQAVPSASLVPCVIAASGLEIHHRPRGTDAIGGQERLVDLHPPQVPGRFPARAAQRHL